MKECRTRSGKIPSSASSSVTSQGPALVQTSMPRFAYNKKRLSERFQTQLKDAELKFITAGSHLFNALENDGVLDLVPK
ncbi:unnamed protein product [Adineta ricciae]|nr:unnamed protein product [Adineta ricciae]